MTTRVKHPLHGFHECTPSDLQTFLDAGFEVYEEPKEVPAIEEVKEEVKVTPKYKKK